MKTILEDAWDEVQNVCGIWVYETLGAEFDRLTTERDRYKQGVEIIATCQGQNFNADYTTGIRFDLFNECIPDFVGQRVRVLVMKEEG